MALVGWVFGTGYFLCTFYWIGVAFFVEAEKFALIMPIAIFGFAAGLALFWAAACGLAAPFLVVVSRAGSMVGSFLVSDGVAKRHPLYRSPMGRPWFCAIVNECHNAGLGACWDAKHELDCAHHFCPAGVPVF